MLENADETANVLSNWPQIYLASNSPRRRDLLLQLGVKFTPLAIEIEEHWDGREPARRYVQRLACEKAQAGLAALKEGLLYPVLGADTSVVLDDRVLGKAETSEEAEAMLANLSGRCHQVLSGVAIVTPDGTLSTAISTSQVHMRPLTKAEITSYCWSGEPIGKAGGYAIQGGAAAFIERIEGSYSGIVGLPLAETASLLTRIGSQGRLCG